MQTEIVISGFGGQGALFAGQVLAYAAMGADRMVTWIPSYGPEMRGGTANCTVIVSDEEIGSPLVRNPTAVIALNLPSLERYENMIKPGGVLIVNSSLVNRTAHRTDIENVFIPANDIAESLGNKRLVNMVVLGALLVKLPILPLEAIKNALDEHIPDRHRKLLPVNYQALQSGADFAMNQAVESMVHA